MTDKPSQLEFFPVPSPCIGVCSSGPKGFCQGCFRSREERLYWLQIDDGTRRLIIKACQRRRRASQRKKRKDVIVPENIQPDLFDDKLK
jgi:predicted Fe-S protein YdhL (DUF1289 family)